jgi:hypothetical protein
MNSINVSNTQNDNNQNPQIPEKPPINKRRISPVKITKLRGNRYTNAQKIAIKSLHQAGLNPSEISRSEHIARSTVYQIIQNEKIEIIAQDQVDKVKRSLQGMMLGNAYRSQNKISDEKLDDMNAYQLTMISAINVDKATLMDNRKDSNHQNIIDVANTKMDDIQKRLEELDKKMID